MKRILPIGLLSLLMGLSVGCGKKDKPKGDDNGTAPVTPKVGADGASPVAPDASNSESPAEGLKALAGNWRVVSIQNSPPVYNVAFLKNVTGQIKDNVLELSEGISYLDRAEIRLDPTTSPKQFDIISLDKVGKPRTVKSSSSGPGGPKVEERPVAPVLGIYNLKGDQLTIAITDRKGYRPTEFKASIMENTGSLIAPDKRGPTAVVVVELTRAKGEKPSGPDESNPPGVARWFLTSFRSRNLDGVLQVSAAPFLIQLDNPKNTRVIEKSGDLKAELQKLMDGWPKLEEFPMGVIESGEGRCKSFPPEEVETLKKLNDPQDKVRDFGGYYVIPSIAGGPDKGGRAKMKLLIKDVGGKPRVVGLVTGDGAYPY